MWVFNTIGQRNCMMNDTIPLTQELVLIGGGHTHALVMRMWGMNPLPGVRLTVINPAPAAPYTGMLPGYVAGHYERDALDIDLVRLSRFARARFIAARAVGFDPDIGVVTLDNGRKIPFHVASFDIGISSGPSFAPGIGAHAIPAKPMDVFADRWDEFLVALAQGQKQPKVAIIGGGIAGAELALATNNALMHRGHTAEVTLLERDNMLANLHKNSRSIVLSHLNQNGISCIENSSVTALSADAVHLADGQSVGSDFTIAAAGARPQPWLNDTGLALQDGYICVTPTLSTAGHPHIFAVGDCAHMTHAPRPKAGVYAVRQAPVLYANLKSSLSGHKKRIKYNPQKDYLKLISLGRKQAVADKWGLRFSGRLLWQWKDRIDRRFMDQFRNLEPMTPDIPAIPVATGVRQMMQADSLCGGCGAKLGGDVLAGMLAQVPAARRADVVSAPGDDAAVLKQPGGGFQIITTDHLREFTRDPYMMARIAAIHALGDCWAMGADPQAALSSITLPPMSPQLQDNFLSDITRSALGVLRDAGADLVGGHTAQGAELSIGFTITGLSAAQPIGHNGAKPGDVIVISKPIGTGTILAGDMALRARGSWVQDTLQMMSRPQGNIARALRCASAMTDVTGFGLAGHVMGIARASGVHCVIDTDRVRYLDGAMELARAGVRSSLYPSNRALLPKFDPGGDPAKILLFDPQTAGGLLAVLSETNWKILQKTQGITDDLHVIGRCQDGPPDVSVGAV